MQCEGHLLHSLLSGYAVFQVAEPEACDQMYESLARLHSNYYKHKVSGLGLCSQPLKGELIDYTVFKCNQYFQLRQQWCPAEAFKGLLNKSHSLCVRARAPVRISHSVMELMSHADKDRVLEQSCHTRPCSSSSALT